MVNNSDFGLDLHWLQAQYNCKKKQGLNGVHALFLVEIFKDFFKGFIFTELKKDQNSICSAKLLPGYKYPVTLLDQIELDLRWHPTADVITGT